MRQDTKRGTASRPGDRASAPPFAALQTTHRAARTQYLVMAGCCVGIGALIIIAGLAGALPFLPALIVGVVTLAVAVFPYRELVERNERIEGLLVLEDEWRELARTTQVQGRDKDRFLDLLGHLYGRR